MTCVKHPWRLIISKRVASAQTERRPTSVRLPDRLLQFIVSMALCGSAWAQQGPQPRLPTVQLQAGMHNIVAEVARTPEQQQIGMMMRTEMATHEGMLFVFDDVSPRCFWMKNTLLPLSIAFIEDDGTIVNIAEMKPRSEASHCSEKPVRYALEMNQGWFSKRAIKPGFRLKGPPFKP
jgi:uncharacterized membrane protein (UPF0127 family)